MDESGVAILERPIVDGYQSLAQEKRFQEGVTSKLQKIHGSPRIWYTEVEGAGPAIFKLHRYSDTQNERAAYLISQLVGFDLVPTTVLRTIEGQVGSLQEFIEDAEFLYELSSEEGLEEELYKLWIFAHVIRNFERYEDNFLIKEGKVISIDHEPSFDPDFMEPTKYNVPRSYYGHMAPLGLVEMFQEFIADDIKRTALTTSLNELLDPIDTKITLKRIAGIGQILIDHGRINSPSELAIW